MRNKVLQLSGVSLLAAALLTSCTSGNESGSGASPQPSAGGSDLIKDVSNQPAELTFYFTSNNVKEESFMKDYGDAIKKKFPNYTIKYVMQEGSKTLPDMITAGQMNIDIMISSIGATSSFLLQYELQNDISDLIKKYNYDLNRLEPTTVEIQKQLANGGMYGLPVSTTSMALFYNKDLFDKFGLPYPKDGATWDEIYTIAQTMTRTQDGVSYKGMTSAFQHAMLMNQLSAAPVDPKTNKSLLSTDSFRQAFENLARFYKIPGNELPAATFALGGQQDPFYKDQKVAMYLTLSGAGKTYKDLMNWDVVQVPFLKDKPGIGPQSYPNYFYITKTSKNKDAAFQVLSYVTSDEFQQSLMKIGTPSILKDTSKFQKDFGVDEPFYKNKNIKSLMPDKLAAPTVKTKHQTAADKEILAALADINKGVDVNTALRSASERLDAAIATAEK